MKFWKKAVSVLLAAVTMMFTGSVTAGAASDDVYVDGFYNTSGKYCVRVGSYALDTFFESVKVFKYCGGKMTFENGVTVSLEDIYMVLMVGDESSPVMAAYVTYNVSKDMISVAGLSCSLNGETYSLETNAKEVESARYYNNGNGDTGIVFFLPKDSKLLNRLAVADNIYLSSDTFFKNDQGSGFLESVDMIIVKPKFDELQKEKGTDKTESEEEKITLKTTTLTAKRSGEKITLSWDAVKGVEKYQIYYREKGESKYKKLATVSGSKTSYSTSKPDKNKTYQFKIRSYAESNGKKVYSKFSKVKTVKVK